MSHVFDLDIIDPSNNTINVAKFVEAAKLELDDFAKNMNNLEKFKDKELTLFEWYAYFGWWNESLHFIDEIEQRLKGKQ